MRILAIVLAAAAPAPQEATCPPDASNCAAATGRVVYVEAVDPDGDGDAHYVLAGGDVTGPGLTVVDVARRLRPRRLPRPGELVSAAGPVFRGSYGQRQMQAEQVFSAEPAPARWPAARRTARDRGR